jgi:putative ABC transport system permease protein
MVVVQVALSLVLLSAGALVVRSFERLLRADPGFESHDVLTMRVPLPTALFPDDDAALALQQRVHEALAALPGVASVSASSALPLTANSDQTTVEIPGAPGNTGEREHDRPLVDYIGTRANYFETLGMRVVEGRVFDDARRPDVKETVIDRNLAEYFFPGGTALGARIPFSGDTVTVVGVVEQARLYDVHRDDRPQLYIRAEDWGYRSLWFALRTQRDPALLVSEIRAAVRGVEPQIAIAEVRTMDEIMSTALRQQRISAVLIGGFAGGALLLAAMGLFGVVSAAVTRRRHELAVRLALGADHGRMLRLVIGEGTALVGAGVLIGAPALYFAGRLLRGVLVGVSPSDPLTLAIVAISLAMVALLACYVPARRVLRIEPARSLRQS